MKLVTLAVPVLMVGCASSPTSDSGPLARCETTDCFYEREVRDFEVIDRETMVVYVGRQRCPFVLELDGFNCDVTFTPQIRFLQGLAGRVGQATTVASSEICSNSRQLYLYSGIAEPEGVDPVSGRRTGPGGFGSPGIGGFGNPVGIDPATGDLCRVRDIRSINDDQLIELYVDQGITPPPPPVGAGELEVVKEDDLPEGSGEAGAGAGQNETGASPRQDTRETGASPGQDTRGTEQGGDGSNPGGGVAGGVE